MVVGIDIGGTKTLVGAFDERGEVVGYRQRIPTAHNPEDFVKDITQLLSDFKPAETDTIIVACPGPLSDGVIMYAPNIGWRNFNIGGILAKKYGCSVYLENDANLAGLGATRALDEIPPLALYITISTGIGGGLIVNGKLLPALAGCEIGHMMFQTSEGLSTWESIASGKAISTAYGRRASEITEPEIWQDIVDNLSVGLRVIIPALQPDIILLGGGVASQFDTFSQLLVKQLQQEIPDYIRMPRILRAKNPETIVLEGCYHYAHDKLTQPQTAT